MEFYHALVRSISSFSLLSNLLFTDRFLLFFLFLHFFYIYTSLLLAPIATCISTQNVLEKEVRTAFEPNGCFNWMIHNLEEKGKFSPILLIHYTYFLLIICCVVLRFILLDLYLIFIFNDYVN
jgi:hypothetical protein